MLNYLCGDVILLLILIFTFNINGGWTHLNGECYSSQRLSQFVPTGSCIFEVWIWRFQEQLIIKNLIKLVNEVYVRNKAKAVVWCSLPQISKKVCQLFNFLPLLVVKVSSVLQYLALHVIEFDKNSAEESVLPIMPLQLNWHLESSHSKHTHNSCYKNSLQRKRTILWIEKVSVLLS